MARRGKILRGQLGTRVKIIIEEHPPDDMQKFYQTGEFQPSQINKMTQHDRDILEFQTAKNVNLMTHLCHSLAVESGWWNDPVTGDCLKLTFNVPEKLCLIHSEISEAMEGYRKNLMDDKLPHRKMIEVELADAIIRIHDLAGAMGLDIGGAVKEKLRYNSTRADHKPENRVKAGGKSF